jgi:hypothetical protein
MLEKDIMNLKNLVKLKKWCKLHILLEKLASGRLFLYNTVMKENTLYVERFRPTELQYYVGNENVKETIKTNRYETN